MNLMIITSNKDGAKVKNVLWLFSS